MDFSPGRGRFFANGLVSWVSFLVVLGKNRMAIPGLPGGFIIYQGHLFALKGDLWLVWLDIDGVHCIRLACQFPKTSI